MTTPDTSAVRAWARAQGLAVAERGRLPAEVHAAYAAAHASGARPKRSRTAPAPAPVPQQPVVDEARVAALEAQVAELTARLARLEQPTPPAAKPSRFRRRA